VFYSELLVLLHIFEKASLKMVIQRIIIITNFRKPLSSMAWKLKKDNELLERFNVDLGN